MIVYSTELPLIPESKDLYVDYSILCAAWCLDLDVGEEIHRFELFGFYQTHIDKKSEQNLQKTISSSLFWDKVKGKGIYKLNRPSKSIIEKLFNRTKYHFLRHRVYKISRDISGKTFSVEINGNNKRIKAFIDGKQTKGTNAVDELKSLTTFNRATHSNSLLWNWIIDGNYYWESE